MHTKLHTENSFTPHVTETRGPWHRDVPNTGVLASTKHGVRNQSENRRLKINYPGANNYSVFTYDGFGDVVQIVETTGGTLASTKQFVRCRNRMCEARNASGSITAQYFNYGQTISGTNYYYTKDQPPGSVREVTDSSGNIQAQFSYDAYGRVTKLQGSLNADFQYGGYYYHAPSGLCLSRTRAYSAQLSRWINRDSIGEAGGVNLYDYVANDPIASTDPDGTMTFTECNLKPWWWPFPWWPFKPKKPDDPPPPPPPPPPGGGGGGGVKPPEDTPGGGGGGGGDPITKYPKPKDPKTGDISSREKWLKLTGHLERSYGKPANPNPFDTDPFNPEEPK